MKATHVIVTGRVQGVWFRAWMREQAEARGLAGWVRNRPDGSVEAVVAGPAEDITELVEALVEGPPAATVAEVRAVSTEMPAEPGFRIVE